MTKIGILATARQANGGTLLYTLSMLEALRRLPSPAYACTLYTAHDNHEYDALGLPIVRLGGTTGVFAARLAGRRLFDEVDVVLAPVYSMKLLGTRRPFAFTLHDLQERHLPQNFGLATRLWRRLTNRLLTRRASRIVCESRFVMQDIVRFFGVPPERVAVIPAPPVTTLRDRPADADAIEAVRRKFALPARYVFYPAQFWPHKNHRRLVDAFARVAQTRPDCALVLTGKQRDEYEPVFARVHELGLTERVRHIGYVETADLAALYRGATVAAIPTLFESISIPVYEAFAVGTAVCASNVVALPEQIGDAGLLFDPHSEEDIAEKIGTLLDRPELRADLIERGHRRIASVTHEGYAVQLAALVDAMVAEDRRRVGAP
jgi:glycosyltransferase involved in cell wall biosynthesis